MVIGHVLVLSLWLLLTLEMHSASEGYWVSLNEEVI